MLRTSPTISQLCCAIRIAGREVWNGHLDASIGVICFRSVRCR